MLGAKVPAILPPQRLLTTTTQKPRPFGQGFCLKEKGSAPYAAMARAGSLLLLSPAVPTAVMANQMMLPGMLPSEL